VKRATHVLPLGFAGFGDSVNSSPAANDAFDVARRAGAPDRQQPLLGLRRRRASQGSHLGVRELAPRKSTSQEREHLQRARHADALTRRAQIEPHAPGEPLGAGAEAVAPAAARIELADEVEEACGRGVEMSRQLGDLVAELIKVSRASA